MLLQESIWKIEDRLNVFLESIADHEAELIRLKRRIDLMINGLERLEARKINAKTKIRK